MFFIINKKIKLNNNNIIKLILNIKIIKNYYIILIK